ncbi:MAG: metalloenzyme [Sporomusaceae bacterium]|nr:metalloenzyme [Sporomusaceae bacterium]
MRVLLIFIDGFGIGACDPAINPMVRFPGRFFPALLGVPLSRAAAKLRRDRLYFSAIDAVLGVDGLPQSATGQTSLFTGVNAPQRLGRHIQAFPGPQLKAIIEAEGLMRLLKAEGYDITSANMYTPDYMALVAARKRRHSATTLLLLAAGCRLRDLDDLLAGRAVYQDITNHSLTEVGIAAPVVSAAEAGRRLAAIAGGHHFTLFEYFQTDRWGHKRDWEQAQAVLETLDAFLCSVYQAAADDLLVILTSDHGNFEDFSVKTHTLNPVPCLIFGPQAAAVGDAVTDLTDFAPAILAYIRGGGA